jgi:Tfp pilus assembly PilM family ATPase
MLKTPNVAKVEYKKAVRWQIKDIIDYPLEDVAVDIFYPQNPRGQAPKKVYVVAAQQSLLKKVAAVIQECGLKLVAIDIRQFALRNLIGDNQDIGILELADTNCVITFLHNHDIHLVRRFPINVDKLRQGNHEELCEELQRSFDYCMTELEAPIPKKLWLLPHEVFTKGLIDKIGSHLNQSATPINLSDLIKFTTPPPSDQYDHYYAALGGALRTIDVEE